LDDWIGLVNRRYASSGVSAGSKINH
jgi:hypothetical protein